MISPHFDDAVFSLGAAIRRWSRSGRRVTILTVLGNDPDSTRASGPWDRRSGFATEGAAATSRRAEDQRACDVLGVRREWLPFGDAEYGGGVAEDTAWAAIEETCAGAALCLIPGFPLTHSDHAWLAGLVLRRGLPRSPIGLYLEQPYASSNRDPRRWVWRPGLARSLAGILPASPDWETIPPRPADRIAKIRASYAYRSQLGLLPARRTLPWRVAVHDGLRGGESVALVTPGGGGGYG